VAYTSVLRPDLGGHPCQSLQRLGGHRRQRAGEVLLHAVAARPGRLHAFADTDQDGQQDPGEPFGDATKTWTLPPNTALCEVTITEGGWIIANNGDRASFGGNAKVSADGSSVQGQQQYQDHGPTQPRTVHSIELTAVTCSDDLSSATIFGTATIDGSGMFVFRIDVIDQGEPGTNDAYGIILSDGYASGQQLLRGGNGKIHKVLTPQGQGRGPPRGSFLARESAGYSRQATGG
jgi:hypothetical protein